MENVNNEIVGIFNSRKDLEKAIDELYKEGIDYSDLSVLAKEDKLKENSVSNLTSEQLAQDHNTPKAPYIANENIGVAQGGIIGGLMYVGTLAAASVIIAAGGGIAATLTTAALAGGASTYLGVALSKILGENHAKYHEEQLNNGGLILWVNMKQYQKEQQIKDIMSRNSAHHIESHNVVESALQEA